jgi:hypothetical protein
MNDKIPRDLKRAVDASPTGAVYTEVPAASDFPEMNKISALFIDIRDDIAKSSGKDPEEIVLIGVKVFYKIGKEPIGKDGNYYAIGARAEFDPEYEHILREIA